MHVRNGHSAKRNARLVFCANTAWSSNIVLNPDLHLPHDAEKTMKHSGEASSILGVTPRWPCFTAAPSDELARRRRRIDIAIKDKLWIHCVSEGAFACSARWSAVPFARRRS